MNPRHTIRGRDSRALLLAAICAFALLAAACGKSQPYGQQDSIIVIMPDSVWAQVEDTTYAALERPVGTMRQESKYHVTQVDPGAAEVDQLRLWHQVVVAGSPGDELVRRVADAADVDELSPPQMISAGSIWSRGQVVRAVVAPPGEMAEAWVEGLDRLFEATEETYRRFARERMWLSGRDSALADSLTAAYGFSLEVPQVYQVIRGEDLVIFRNDNPSPADLIRSVTVAWRSDGTVELEPETAAGWRAALDSVHYGTPQSFTLDTASVRAFTHRGHEALEVRGNWADEGSYPAGGPVVLWLVDCGERTYLLDTWLYAPNPERGKYQYLLQLEWIRESFRCETVADG